MESQYWEELLFAMDRKDDSSFRRYRRYNKSLEAMGEKTVVKEAEVLHRVKNSNVSFDSGMKLLKQIENAVLYRALLKLKQKEMLIIILVYEKGLTFSEIASIMNPNYDTVQKRHYRAIEKFKKFLKNFLKFVRFCPFS